MSGRKCRVRGGLKLKVHSDPGRALHAADFRYTVAPWLCTLRMRRHIRINNVFEIYPPGVQKGEVVQQRKEHARLSAVLRCAPGIYSKIAQSSKSLGRYAIYRHS
jgi:hypothetical protein